MTALAYADTEAAVRRWARDHTGLIDVIGHRTFFALPDDYDPAVKGNAISFSQIGGAPDGYSPLDMPELQFSCWGASRGDAYAVRTALISALHSLTRTTVSTDSGDVTLLNATVTSAFYRPDNSADPVFPRYIVTAAVAAIPSS